MRDNHQRQPPATNDTRLEAKKKKSYANCRSPPPFVERHRPAEKTHVHRPFLEGDMWQVAEVAGRLTVGLGQATDR